ncbi:MAG: histone-like nucleoid-structuring protein Lsr2 [Jatrophihabitantaceae bacterium]
MGRTFFAPERAVPDAYRRSPELPANPFWMPTPRSPARTGSRGSMRAMAKQTVVTELLVDDIDGSTAERTVNFTWDGTAYEIELSKKNVVAFEKAMKPYVDAARRMRSSRARRGSAARGGKRDLGAIRDWAASNGFDVSTRGRIAATVIDAYDAANR